MFKFFNDHFTKSMSAFCDSDEQITKFTSESTCVVDKVITNRSFIFIDKHSNNLRFTFRELFL